MPAEGIKEGVVEEGFTANGDAANDDVQANGSNGWEIALPFRDVQVSRAEPVYPLPGTVFVPTSTAAAAPSA